MTPEIEQRIKAEREKGMSIADAKRLRAKLEAEHIASLPDTRSYAEREAEIVEKRNAALLALQQQADQIERDTNAALQQQAEQIERDTNAALLALADEFNAHEEQRARAFHYPECWDTTVYPTFESAEREFELSGADKFECGNDECPHTIKLKDTTGTAIAADFDKKNEAPAPDFTPSEP